MADDSTRTLLPPPQATRTFAGPRYVYSLLLACSRIVARLLSARLCVLCLRGSFSVFYGPLCESGRRYICSFLYLRPFPSLLSPVAA